jgi:general secretion pathway protein L
MSLLRIYVDQLERTEHCQWVLLGNRGHQDEPVAGEGRLADLAQRVQRVSRVQLVIAASQILITRARIPRRARRDASSVLAFAVEEKIASDPAANQVSWLGSVGAAEMAALAVVDKSGLAGWCAALAALGLHVDAVHSELLMLPLQPGEWSLAWNGREGFVRCGIFEGRTTDEGGRDAPPLSLRLMLDEATADGTRPPTLALYVTHADAAPDWSAWQQKLGIKLRQAGTWDWRSAAAEVGTRLDKPGPRWQMFYGVAPRLRAAAWILAAALVLHALALMLDWNRLAGEQRALRQQMESQFRESFPDAVAVADPVLQMRRKLAEARHRAGQADSGDFLPLVAQVAAAAKNLSPGVLQVMSYEGGQMQLELVTGDDIAVQQLTNRLQESGLRVATSINAINSPRKVHVLTVSAL